MPWSDPGGSLRPGVEGHNVTSAKAWLKVKAVFTALANHMPATAPGMPPHDDDVDVMAYLLRQNGYPAGGKALRLDDAMKSTVAMFHGDPAGNPATAK